MDPIDFYSALHERVSSHIQALKKRDTMLAVGRGIAGISVLIIAYMAAIQGTVLLWVGTVILVVIFAILLKRHQSVRSNLAKLESKSRLIQQELAFLNRNFSHLDEGADFKSEDHLYENDLDILGRASLFTRLSRCATPESRSRLAKRLLDLDWDQVELKQGAVQELSQQPEDMLNVRASLEAVRRRNILPGVEKWSDHDARVSWVFQPALLLALSVSLPAGLALIALSGQWQYLDALGYLFVFNLIYFGIGHKIIKQEHQWLDRVHKDLATYAEVLQMLDEWKFESTQLRELKERLNVNTSRAADHIRRLGVLLGRLDTLNNVVVLVLLNGFFLFHMHVLRSVVQWKKSYGHSLLDWLAVVEDFQVWMSLATYAFHHPRFTYPVQAARPTFEAMALGHPFLSDQKRVDNDVTFEDHKIKVLTGSNMAGKSTFLRSIGLNIILAANGLPVCADRLEISPVRLLSSMKPQDSINDDRSYFQAEIIRLRSILDAIEAGGPSMVLFDEILRGTNSEDKRMGTMAFVAGLENRNLMGVLATHDIEISQIAEEKAAFKNFYFESVQVGDELKFDFILRQGVCRTPNATMLLHSYGLIDRLESNRNEN